MREESRSNGIRFGVIHTSDEEIDEAHTRNGTFVGYTSEVVRTPRNVCSVQSRMALSATHAWS